MLIPCIAIVVGLLVLVWSSDKFVDGAASLAENFGISKLMIGLTVVAFGTSAPEILVSAIASYQGSAELAVGNALGSNIANIGLVLGVTAMVVSIPVHRLSAVQDLPIYLWVIALTGWILHDSFFSQFDAALLLINLAILAFLVLRYRSRVKDPVLLDALTGEVEEHEVGDNKKAFFIFSLGLVFLLLSSRLLVWGAVEIAHIMGVSELIIGLTIVAIGTSLPEFAATLASALKNHHDIAIGNVLGSNILNLLIVFALPGLIAPGALSESIFYRDYFAMLILSLLMTLFIFVPYKNPKITRAKGFVLVSVYCVYVAVLVKATI